jgi:hypothetical protein
MIRPTDSVKTGHAVPSRGVTARQHGPARTVAPLDTIPGWDNRRRTLSLQTWRLCDKNRDGEVFWHEREE